MLYHHQFFNINMFKLRWKIIFPKFSHENFCYGSLLLKEIKTLEEFEV